jgi:predicted ATPase
VYAVQEHAGAAISLATEQDFPFWIAVGTMLHGWALAHQGRAKEGVEQLTQGLSAFRAMECGIMRPYYLALLADVYDIIGEPETGLAVLTEALTLMNTTSGRGWEPGLYRLKGELLLQQSSDNQAEAETCFLHALSVARPQQAKSLELRAAISLAKLWQSQGKRQEAYNLLMPVYNGFTEGFDTADLIDAKALFDELA